MRELGEFSGTQRYRPTRLIGKGGMGAVYEVLDLSTGSRVALKVMLVQDPARLLRFKNEFRVVAELHHPNLVRLFDLGQHEGQWFFTMELVHGHDLLEVLLHDEAAPSTVSSAAGRFAEAASPPGRTIARRGPACDPDLLIGSVAQVLDALEFIHGRGIVHRDLKPSNILLDVEGTVHLLDFGVAMSTDRAATITRDGAVVGSLAYLSPEQLQGEAASAASDRYALGCMMFQLLTGALPFAGSSMTARLERPPPRVDERVTGVPPALAEVVHRLMAREPAERPSIAEVRAALGLAPGAKPGVDAASRSAVEGARTVDLARPSPGRGPSTEPAAAAEPTAETFIGRQRELAILAGCLERAAAGEPQIALVSGPSGIGKSAFASVVARRAGSLGFLCFSGRCYEREHVPFVAFDRVMDALALTLRRWPPARLAAMRPTLLVLERIFPALGLLTGPEGAIDDDGGSARPAVDPRELHQQVLDGFRRLCDDCQAEAPLCFVLDDLQWADEESVELLSAITEMGEGRIMVLGLFRSEGLRADHPLHRLLGRQEGQGRAATIALSALDAADALRLVEAVTGSRLDPGTSAALAAQAGGSPFLVRRLAEHLATLPPGEQAARLADVGSTDGLLRTSMGTLGVRAHEILALASAAGGEVDASLLGEASGLGGAELDLGVGELLAERFLKTVPAGPGAEAALHLDLYHDRIREVVYQGLTEDRRRMLHRSLGLALEARPAGRGRDAEALARHFGEAGDRSRKRRYTAEAAEQAAAKLAFVRAARLFRAVLDDPEPGEDPLATAARWERVGDLFEYGGLHLDAARSYQEALRRWEAAPEDHPERLVALLRLRGLAGANLMATKHVGEGRATFERGLATLGLPLDRPLPSRLAVLAVLKARAALAERLDDLRAWPAAAWGAAGASLGGAPSRASLAAEVRFLDLMVRAFQPFWPLAAAEAALRAELLGRRIDDKLVLFRSLAFGAAVPVILGRCSPEQLDQAHRRLDKASDLARAHKIPLGRELCQLNRSLLWMATDATRARRTCEMALEGFARRGMAESFDGIVARAYYFFLILGFRGDDGDVLAASERELGVAHPNFVMVTLARVAQIAILARRGRCAEAREALGRLEAHLAGVPPSRFHVALDWSRAAVTLAEGRFAEVLAMLEPAEERARASGTWGIGFDRCYVLEIEVAAAVGALRCREISARALGRARASAAWLVRRGVLSFPCVGYRALALLDHAEGRKRSAARAIQRALSLSSAGASPYHRWLCLEAARDLGALTLDQEAEAEALAEEGRFVLPRGWAGRPATHPGHW